MSNVTDDVKKIAIRKYSSGSPCCVCGGIPMYQVHYPVVDGIERYCPKCIEKAYAREPVF